MSELMTLEDIAALAHCNIRHARDVLVRLAGFPEEAPISTPRNRLWVTSEVLDYVNRRPVRAPEKLAA